VYKFKYVTHATLQEYIEFHFRYLFRDCLAAIFIYRDRMQRRLDIEPNVVVSILRDVAQTLYDVSDDEFAFVINKIVAKIRGRFLKKIKRNPLACRLADLPDVEVCYARD
jgi:hypothetical protein